MKVELYTLCDFAQENNGKLTIVGTFDTIVAKVFPMTHQSFALAVRLRFDIWELGLHSFKIEARDLDGNSYVQPVEGTLTIRDVGNASSVVHLLYSFMDLKCKMPTVINFILYIDDKEITSTPLYIKAAAKKS
ncbi:hypothetical protein [Gracilinema caldarium]|uniref:DUF6941 family protein n=1 Tax=Gracilinema caldarium TaxID=215591 RepID=UPI0026ECF858|nr:hypothetical protein [Gracilinema caldarium]